MKNNSAEYIIAKEKAIKYIGISKKTEYEVIKKLKGLGIASLVVDAVIQDLKELGYVDDKEYAKSFVRQNERFLKYSIYEIKQKMLQKGINISIIEDSIQKILLDDYEQLVIDKLKNGKLKSYEKIKQKEYLYRRGFKTN